MPVICEISRDCRHWKQFAAIGTAAAFSVSVPVPIEENEARPHDRHIRRANSRCRPNSGGQAGSALMHFIDLVGAMAAYRHSRTHVVTAAMDHIDFIQPVHVGDLLILKSSVNRAFSKSVEVGVKVWAENTQAGEYRHVASAYLVFVAIDKDGNPVRVPELLPETADELRRYEGALRRRGNREAESERRKRAKLAPAGQGSVRPGKG